MSCVLCHYGLAGVTGHSAHFALGFFPDFSKFLSHQSVSELLACCTTVHISYLMSNASVKTIGFVPVKFWIRSMMVLQMLLACTSTSSLMSGTDIFKVRSFSSPQDKDNLAEICKDVWNGKDYLPNIAPAFEQDPSCDFVIMEHEKTGEMVAAGNRRIFDEKGKVIWIESIRVSTKFKGRGIATVLMKELCKRSREAGAKEILSCTVDDNYAMKKVFGKAGVAMNHRSNVQFSEFQKLKSLPGWSAMDSDRQPRNILKALDVEHLVQEEAKSEHWKIIESEKELKSLLETLRNHGMSGHLPGLGKLLWLSDELRDSIRKGLVRKLCKKNGDPPAVMALVKDPSIKSLRSKYVCSVVATTAHDFDSALWEACKGEIVPLLGGSPAFCLVFDGASSPGSLIESLPISRENPFVIYGWQSD